MAFPRVPLGSLTSWADWLNQNDVEAEKDGPQLTNLKFPMNKDLNKRIYLWQGDIRSLEIDAIVNPTNETMSEITGLSGQILEASGSEIRAEIFKTENCKTGEARITKGYQLPARFVIHTVGPRYNDKYRTAAENALHNCYRSSLALLKESGLSTIAFPVVNSVKKGYPQEPGAHIAIRTVRRFLEHWGDGVSVIVFVLENAADLKLYQRVLPLYFPRNRREEQVSKEELPRDTGNEFGETVIEERKIRIQALPTQTPTEESAPKSVAPAPVIKIDQNFSSMKGISDLDEERRKKMEGNADFDRARIEQLRLYQQWLQLARKEDLSDVSRLNCIYESGRDSLGRTIVVVVGARLPTEDNKKLDRVFLYMIRLMDAIVDRPYVVLYLHTGMNDKDKPEWSWMKKVYNILDYKYGQNLGAFYILHPTFWLKMAETVASAFISSEGGFFEKVRYMEGLRELFDHLDRTQLNLPEEVFQYDVKEFGTLSVARPKTNLTKAEALANDL